MPEKLLLVVADSSRARFFTSSNGQAKFHEHDDLMHPASRLHAQELTTDLPGSGFAPGGAKHGFTSRVSVKDAERQAFAREISAFIEKQRVERRFTELMLVASPSLLGDLRSSLSQATRATITQTVDKNLVRQDLSTILSAMNLN